MTFHSRVKTKRIIEKPIAIAGNMEMPPFPCFMVDISTRQDDLIGDFLTKRPSQNWLMLADYAALTDHQLWTAWLLSQRAFAKGKALARSIDAEFLRYIAGTHHVSEAFKKVEYRNLMIGHGLSIYQNMKKTMMSYTRLLISSNRKKYLLKSQKS